MKRAQQSDQMRFGIVWSILVHIILFGIVAIQWPSMLDFNQQQQAVQVKIVSAKSNKPIEPKQVKKAEPVFTQQSAAPAKPPKPQPLKKNDAPKVAKVEKKQVVKEKPKPQPKKQANQEKQQKRPEKLDKSKDKKQVVKDEKAKPKPKTNDDFLKALSFIENLKEDSKEEETPAEQDGDEDSKLLLADMEEINRIKKHISNNWLKPSGMVDEPAIAIEVRINRDGSLKSVRVIKSSGLPFFDNSLLRAVRKSEPIPYPADKYKTFKVMEIIWNG
ncbi:MAG: TonB family protein [Pseudomonadota bacterium]|nr:TonB family protein [Pseudomonadota bacterium]